MCNLKFNLHHLLTLIINYWNAIINKSIVLINILLIGFIWVLIIIYIYFVFLNQVASFGSKFEIKNERIKYANI